VLKARGITVSMSRKGDCWDNSPMESANGTLKVECVHGENFKTRDEARQAILDYIGYYNTQRRHSSLGYVPIAVGTPITGRPPHRSGRAQLRHPAPAAGE
jgi:transposase InsO family protein